jgi:ketosteroid isomerase-like protein
MGAAEAGQLIEQFGKFFSSGDVDGLLSLYEDDAIVPTDQGVLRGKEAIRGWLQSFVDSGAVLTFGTSVVLETGDIALTHNVWSTPDGGGGVTAEVLRKQSDGTWKYLVDNPVGGAVTGS